MHYWFSVAYRGLRLYGRPGDCIIVATTAGHRRTRWVLK